MKSKNPGNPLSPASRKASARARAAEMAADRAKRTPEEQLKLIASRPGESKRETKRLRKLIVEASAQARRAS